MRDWENSSTEVDKMTVEQWLDKLTDENWHTERCVVEAIIDGRESIIRRAMLIWLYHMDLGHMPTELGALRRELYEEMSR